MAKKLTRKDRQELYGRMSKYFEDVSKLILAGVVLSSIKKILICGGLFVVVCW